MKTTKKVKGFQEQLRLKLLAQMDGMTARRSTLIHGMKISQRS